MDSQITFLDKLIIIKNTIPKVIRGLLKKIFLKKTKGLLFLGKHVSLTHANNVTIGSNVKFEDYSEIHGLATDGLIFGNNVTIGRSCKIRPSSYYGKDIGKGIIIGDNSSIGPEGYVGCSGKIVIGNNVMIGPKCSLFAENHRLIL